MYEKPSKIIYSLLIDSIILSPGYMAEPELLAELD